MRLSPTLTFYIGRQFLFWFAVVFLGFAAIVLLFDSIELLRRAQTRPEATYGVVLQMALLKLPHMMELLVPFVMLFSAMLAFWRLTRGHELVVARAAGVSVWQCILPTLVAAFAIGVFKITIYSPLSSIAQERYERLDGSVLKNQAGTLTMSGSGFWLRDTERTPGRDAGTSLVVHAERLSPGDMALEDVTVFQFRENDQFIGRLDAARGRLDNRRWQLEDAWVSGPNANPQRVATYTLPTELTWGKIEESFASPDTMSFWSLPGFIRALEAAGFPALRHRLHFHAQLATPFLLCAMVMIAATFSLRPNRRTGTGMLVAAGIGTGFLLYVVSDLVLAIGLSARIPAEMAAWAPVTVCMMLGVAALMHLEDG